MKNCLLIFFLVIITARHSAQSFADSIIINPVIDRNSYLMNYDKQFYTHALNTMLTAGISNDNFSGGVNLNIASVVTRSGQKSLRDQNQLAFVAGYNPARTLNFSLITSHENYKDTRETGLNFLSNTEVIAMGKLSADAGLSTSVFYGYVQNKQLGDIEAGDKYGFWGKIINYDELDMLINGALVYEREKINLRNKQSSAFRLRLEKDFDEGIRLGFSSSYSSKSRDFYIKADSGLVSEYGISKNILTRNEDEVLLNGNILLGNQQKDISFYLTGGLISKGVSRLSKFKSLRQPGESIFDSRLDEISIIFNAGADYISKLLVLRINVGLNSRDEKQSAIPLSGINPIFFEKRSELEAKKNNIARRAILSLYGDFMPGSRDKFTIQLFQSKLKYDTPSLDNFDDRDETLSIIRLRYSRTISRNLIVFISGEYTHSKLVYIFAQKSANNTTGRFYKINTGNELNYKSFNSKNLFEISANYSVYDYEAITSGYKSFSFRQLYFSDSSTVNLGKSVKFGFNGFYRLSEQSELKWTEFTIKPVRLLEEFLLFPKIMTNAGSVYFSVGLRRFTIFTYTYLKARKTLLSEFKSIGPAAELEYFAGSGLMITFRGWHEFNSASNDNSFELTNFYSEIKYFF